MRTFHVTPAPEAILQDGFLKGVGVWLSDEPVDFQELGFQTGLSILTVDFPDEFDLRPYEVVDEGDPPGYRRQWLLTPEVVNSSAVVAFGSPIEDPE